MYDELTKGLRFCATEGICAKCNFEQDGFCSDNLMKQAADTIEELKRDLEREKEYSAFWQEQAENTKDLIHKYMLVLARVSRQWISVNDVKPKLNENVIVTDGTNVGMGWRDIFTDRKTGLEYAEWFAPNCKVDDDHITHWMRFPEAPKEELHND